MKERLGMVLSIEELERISILEGVLFVDVHGLTRNEMVRFLKNVSLIPREPFSMTIIHGFNHGTKLKETVRYEDIISRPHTIVTDKFNPGVTTYVFAA